MQKKILITLTLSLIVLLGMTVATPLLGVSTQRAPQTARSAVATASATGTLQKMIVENGTVTLNLDLNQLNGIGSHSAAVGQNLEQVRFAVGANSFFPILIFNDSFRAIAPGSMTLVPQGSAAFPAALNASLNRLVVEKLPSGQGSDLTLRDRNTGFTFFTIQGAQYEYDT